MMRSAAVDSHRDQAEEVGSDLASSAAFSALRNQAISRCERPFICKVYGDEGRRATRQFCAGPRKDPRCQVVRQGRW